MTDHDAPIGQEWHYASPTWTSVCDLIKSELDSDVTALEATLMLLAASAPRGVRAAVLEIAHDRGRHSNGRCSEHCPRF